MMKMRMMMTRESPLSPFEKSDSAQTRISFESIKHSSLRMRSTPSE